MSTWAGEMTDTVTIAPMTGVDAAARPTFGTQSTIACFYVAGSSIVRDAEGKIVDVTATFYTHDEVGDDYAVWPEGADTTKDTEARTPSKVTHYHDLSGADDLWEVEL